MKKNRFASLAAALGLSLLSACGSPTPAGTYHLDKTAIREAMAAKMKETMPKETPADAVNKQLDEVVANMDVTVELKADGTAETTSKMGKGPEKETGTWKLEGDNITLTTKTKDGKEESKTGKYADGVIRIDVNEGPMPMQLVLRRS